jgi:class 3 adenylate cyclase/DNA-binding transcriptional MerR regulator
MIEEKRDLPGWISSLDIIRKTGISRATLNNYIKMNILPRPMVKKPEETTVRARMLGYFPESVIDSIEQIKLLKKQGYNMDEIIEMLKGADVTKSSMEALIRPESSSPDTGTGAESFVQPEYTDTRMMPQETRESLSLTINEIKYPAYLLNSAFEIDWINAEAENEIFHEKISDIKEPAARNIFRLLMRGIHREQENIENMLDFHLSFVKEIKSDRGGLFVEISPEETRSLEKRYDQIERRQLFSRRTRIVNDLIRQRMPSLNISDWQAINKSPLVLCNDIGMPFSGHVNYMLFREGMLFIHTPMEDSVQVSYCVLLADLQNSVRICAELPPEEYFELINQIWTCVEGSFKQYYGTHGKHAGDGILYYFLKERDNQYMMNALACALEIRENMKKLNMEWKLRKGWLNDLYLNVGLNEGEEYFGMIPAAPGIEFTSLGDTVNHASRLSDFARSGAIWTTKNLINKLGTKQKESIHYGIRHMDRDRVILVENSFGRIMDMMTPDNVKNSKFVDIATLAVTEIIGWR